MSNVVIRFSEHAKIKFDIFTKHGLDLDEATIVAIIEKPEKTVIGYRGRMIAQGRLDANRVLRIVYEEKPEEIIIVTFYPGKRERYG
jgi:uncharacterized DUF497 family protein